MYTDLQKVFCPCHFSQYITPQFFQKMIVKAFFVQFEKNTQYFMVLFMFVFLYVVSEN